MTWIPNKIKVDGNIEHVDCDPNVMYCPHCGIEQAEHPQNIFVMNENDQECDECGKVFFIEQTTILRCGK